MLPPCLCSLHKERLRSLFLSLSVASSRHLQLPPKDGWGQSQPAELTSVKDRQVSRGFFVLLHVSFSCHLPLPFFCEQHVRKVTMAHTVTMDFVLWLSLLLGQVVTQHLAARASTVPAPIVIPPSQNFEGNDGPWSTFTLRIGSPAQDVNVMVSTAGYQTWAVVPQGCPSSEPADCAKLRGGLYNYNESSTWAHNNVTSIGTFTLGLEENLGYTGNGLYGYDTVALGWQGSNGPSLDQQIVAGIATPDFYLGTFGLDPRPTNFTNYNNPVTSYISNLKQQKIIPSLSWGYTAGNQYRENKVLGSLTLGGYDTSRFAPNDVIFPFDTQDIQALTVQIASITYTANSQNTSLLSTPISAFVDSTVPWIYLPLDACKKFEEAFGIVYDNSSQAYLVNNTLHDKLIIEHATVTFVLQNSTRGAQVEISLPYASFDLVATYPLAANSTRYFPLARATNSSQYTIGRTFFQEAYVTADYERRTFTVSQCTWDPNARQNITMIKSLADQQVPTRSDSHHISGGAIAGIVLGSIFGVAAIVGLGFFLYRRFAAHHHETDEFEKPELDSSQQFRTGLVGDKHTGQEIDGKHYIGAEVDSKRLPGHEIDGKRFLGHELAGNVKMGHELDSGQHGSAEMPAREMPSAELP